MTVVFYSAFGISFEVVYLQHCLVVGWRHVELLPSRCILCTPYNRAACHYTSRKATYVCACVFNCNLPPEFLAEWPESSALLHDHGSGTNTEIRPSTESWPWRRNFSRRSSQDSNHRPFDHESGAINTDNPRSPLTENKNHLQIFLRCFQSSWRLRVCSPLGLRSALLKVRTTRKRLVLFSFT